MRLRFLTCAAAVLAAPALATPAWAMPEDEEATVTLRDAPLGALAAAEAAVPGVVFSSAALEIEDGVATYEFTGTDGDGNPVEIDIGEWVLLEVERPITVDDLPEAVRETLDATAPGLTINGVEESDRGQGVIVYEFDGVNADGEEVDVEISAFGESVVVLNDNET